MIILHALGQCLIRTSLTTITPRAELGFALATRLIADRGRRFSRRHLTALFWPDVDERTAAHSLSEALHKLRRRGVPIETDEAHAVWVPRDAAGIDVERIGDASPAELAERDLAVLPGFEPRGSAALRDWADEWRDELRARTVRGLRLVIAQAERDEDWSNVMLLAEQALRLDHTDPSALAARVRAADALRRQHPPDRASMDVTAPRAAGSATAAPAGAVVREGVRADAREMPRLVCAVSTARPSKSSAPIVGRDAELAVLGDAWDRARHGHGGRLWVYGPSGIGKTRLVAQSVSTARRTLGAAVEVACEPGDAQRPLSTFIRLVPRLRRLPGAAGCSPETTPFLDRLTEHDAANPLWPDAADAPHIAACVQQAIVDLVDAVADEQPLLLAIDDAQWIDEDSARLVMTLTLAAASRPLLLLMSSCEACPTTEADCVATIPVALAPLDDDAAREHVIECCGGAGREPTAELLEWFVDAGEGNPLRLEELVNHWRTTGAQFELPPTLGALLQSRVTALGSPARRVLQMAAVLGRHSTLARIERALGFSEEVLLEALEELGRTAMVRVGTDTGADDGTLTCRHGALAEAALAQLSPPALQMLHRRAALVLESDGPLCHSTEMLWDRAEHWSASGATGRAATGLACVAHLVDIGLVPAALTACRHLADSCSSPQDRALVLQSLASLLHLTRQWSDLDSVILDLRTDSSSARTHDDIELLALDAAWQRPTEWPAALETALRCVDSTDATHDHRVRAGIIALKLATNTGCVDTMHAVHAALQDTVASGLATPLDCHLFAMIYHTVAGDFVTAAHHASAILTGCELAPSARELRQMLDCAIALARAGALPRAIGTCAQVADLAARYGMPAVEAEACHRAITMLVDRGEFSSATLWIDRYGAIMQSDASPGRSRSVMLACIRVTAHEGDIGRALTDFAAASPPLCEDLSPMFRATALATRVVLDIRSGESPDVVLSAVTELMPLNRQLRGMGAQDYETYALAAGFSYCGRREEARDLVDGYLKHDRRDPFPVPGEIAAMYSERAD